MRKTLGVCLLVLLLTGSASAGIMPNDVSAPPPSQPTSASQEPTADGEMPNDAAGALTQAVLTVLVSLLP